MICKCGCEGVFVPMNITPGFWYCRKCKIEIDLEVYDPPPVQPSPEFTDEQLLKDFEEMLEWPE